MGACTRVATQWKAQLIGSRSTTACTDDLDFIVQAGADARLDSGDQSRFTDCASAQQISEDLPDKLGAIKPSLGYFQNSSKITD